MENVVDKFTDAMNRKDALEALCCLQQLCDISESPDGVQYLHKSGTLRLIESKLREPHEDSHLLIPGYLRVYGFVGKDNISLLIDEYSLVIEKILEFANCNDEPLLLIAIETIGLLGRSLRGKKIFCNSAALNSKLVQLVDCSDTNVKSRALSTICQLLEVSEADPNGEISSLIEQWFKSLSANITQKIFSLSAQPFEEVKLPAYEVIHALACHLWGQKLLASVPGFIDNILDRSKESGKAGKEAKYAVVSAILDSEFASFVFNRDVVARLKLYKKQGTFFVETETSVATEESR